MENAFVYDTIIGRLMITDDSQAITGVFFENHARNEEYVINETQLHKQAIKQLEEYFAGKRKKFDLMLNPKGTDFQQRVWESLLEIPYGHTASYKDIAKAAGNEKACRAVGMANNRNPISVIIPCHRVIGRNGKLVGYGGGLEIKEFLLNLEKANA